MSSPVLGLGFRRPFRSCAVSYESARRAGHPAWRCKPVFESFVERWPKAAFVRLYRKTVPEARPDLSDLRYCDFGLDELDKILAKTPQDKKIIVVLGAVVIFWSDEFEDDVRPNKHGW